MLSPYPAAGAAAAAVKAKTFRVAGVTINKTAFETIAPADYVALLLRILDLCVVPAEQRYMYRGHTGSNCDIPAALYTIDVRFDWEKRANAPILGPLATNYPALVRSLRVLKIVCNDYDESAALGAFAALATRLQELTFQWRGPTSVQGLAGRCKYLRKVNLFCCKQLTNIDALADRVYLEEVNASYTGITSIEPLRSCPNLKTVNLCGCQRVSSIDALAGYQWLQVVDASVTGITSIDPLLSCPNLAKVNLCGCQQLSEIHAIEGHQRLQDFDASYSGITSIEPLRSCPNLKTVNFCGCQRVSSIDALASHQWLQEVDASETAITSIEPLRSCPALTKVELNSCNELPADVSMPASIRIIR